MGFQYVVPVTVGGTVLIIERIESQNYVAGVSGWAIMADGSAEFANLVARGTLIGGQVVINGTAYPNAIALETLNPSEVEPAVIEPISSGNNGKLRLNSPILLLGGTPGTFDLSGFTDGTSSAELDVDRVRLTAGDSVTIETTDLRLSGDFATYLQADGTNPYLHIDGETWNNFAFAGTWANFAGFTTRYYKDANGIVHVAGAITGGAAVAIGTLPAGYRPSQTFETLQRGANPGPIMCAIQVSPAGAVTLITNLASAAVRCAFDFAFPTF